MSPQKRRSLSDDAAAFVFGSDTPPTSEPLLAEAPDPPASPAPSNPKQPAKAQSRSPKAKTRSSRAIDELMQSAEQERQVRITIDLAASQHRSLTRVCADLGKSKAEIIRALVDDFLNEVNS